MYYNNFLPPGYDYVPGQPQMPQQQNQFIPQQNTMMPPQQMIDPRVFDTPTITVDGGIKPTFTIEGTTDNSTSNNKMVIPVDPLVPDVVQGTGKKRGRPKKSESTEIVRSTSNSNGNNNPITVEDTPTAYTYMETTGMLRETLAQIDALNAELVSEFENVKHSRTMKNKYNVLVGLSENVGSLLSNKISAIREINSAITKSNDLDYKKIKDRRASEAQVDDDKYIADLYKSFISQPQNTGFTPQMPQFDPNTYGSTGIIRAELHSGDYNTNGPVDASYLNYVSNLTPEQNLMRYEGNPNVKQVVVWDKSTDNKIFQMMDMSTGQVIPNVPVYDQMFMEDTIIDPKSMMAKNTNLNETFPVITINEDPVLNQY